MAPNASRPDPGLEVRIVASARRRRTVSARLVDGVIEVRVPAWMPQREREQWANRMRERLRRQIRRAPQDTDLEGRARELNRLLFDGALRWNAIGFAEQRRRWGSCSPASGVIRIARRAAALPGWVVDYIVTHELAHLLEANHGPRFWALAERYPLTERARGYLMAIDYREGVESEPDTDLDDGEEVAAES
jgi:predicted metal-dependent hydrolase